MPRMAVSSLLFVVAKSESEEWSVAVSEVEGFDGRKQREAVGRRVRFAGSH